MGKITNTLLRLGLFVVLLLGFTASTAWAQITPADINTGGPGTYSDDLVVAGNATIDINGTAVLEGDLTINPGVTLTLAPGTILEMEDNAVITIGGATIDGEGQLQITTSTGLVEIILTGANPTATIQDLLINKPRGRVEISIFEPTTPGQEGNLTITESLQIVAGTVEANRNFITYQVDLDLFDAFDDDEQPVLSIAEDAEISGDRALVLDIIGTITAPETAEAFVAKGTGTLGMLLWQINAPESGTTVEFSAIGNGGASQVTAGQLSLPNLATLDGSLDVSGETAVVIVDEDLEISDDLTVDDGGEFQNNFATTIGENLTIINGPAATDTSVVRFYDEASVGGDLSMDGLSKLTADIRAGLAENHLVTVEGDFVVGATEGVVIDLNETIVATVEYYNNLAIGGNFVAAVAPLFDLEDPLNLIFEGAATCTIMDADVEENYVGAGNFVQFFGDDAVLDFAENVLIPSVVVAKDSGDDLEIDDEAPAFQLQVSVALLIASGDFRTNGLLNLDPNGADPGAAAIAVARRDGARGQLLAGASGSAYTVGGEPDRVIYLGNEGFFTGAEVPGDAEESELVEALILGVSAADAVITISRDMTVTGELGLCEGQLDVGSAFLTLGNGVNVIVRNGEITRLGNPPFQGELIFPEIVLREEDPDDLVAGIDGIDLLYISTEDREVTLEFPSKADTLYPYVIRDLTINTTGGAAISLREGEDFAIYGNFTSLSGDLLLNGNTFEIASVNDGEGFVYFQNAGSSIVGTDTTGLLLLTGEQYHWVLFDDDEDDDVFELPATEINKAAHTFVGDDDPTLDPVVFAEADFDEGQPVVTDEEDAFIDEEDDTTVRIWSLLVTSASTVDGVTVLESVENFEVVNDFTLLAGEFQLDPEASDGIEDVCDLYDIVVDRDDDEVRQWVVVGGDLVVNGQVRAFGNYVQVDGNLTVEGEGSVFDGANNDTDAEGDFDFPNAATAESFTVSVGEALTVGSDARFYLANGQARLLGDYDFQGEYDVNSGAAIQQGARGTVFFEGSQNHLFSSSQEPAAQLNNVWLRTTGEVTMASDMVLNSVPFDGYACDAEAHSADRYVYGGGELTLQLGVVNSQGADGEDNWVVRLLNPDAEDDLDEVNNPGIPSDGAVQLGTRDSYVNGEVERLIAEGNATGGVVTGGYFYPVGSADEQGRKFIAPLILQFATTLPVDTSRSASVKILKTDDPLIAAMNANFEPFDVPGVGGETLSLNFLNPTNVVYRIDFGGIPAEDPNIRVIAGDLINRVDEINALRLVAFDCDGTNPRLAGTYDVTVGGPDDPSAIENDFINGVPNITMEGVDVTGSCMLVTVATDQFINALTPSAVDRALVQVIHAAPNTGEVDVEIEGRIARTGFGYGEATPFLRVVAEEEGTQIRLLVDGEAVFSDALQLEENQNYIAVIAEDEEGLLRILVEDARTEARNQEMVEIVAVNAMSAHPLIDIVNWDAQTVPFNNIAFGDYSRYQPFQPQVINFEIVDEDNDASLNVVRAELGEFTGDALAAVAVDDPVVGPTLLLVTAGGMVVEQQVVTDAEEASELPAEFALNGNYPNPFNPSTTISFNLPQNADVTVEVVDMLGRRVMTVPVQTMQAGMNRTIQLNATELASGVYLYRVIAKMADQTRVETGRMTLLK